VDSGIVVGNTYDLSVSIGTAEAGVRRSVTLRGKLAPPSNVRNFTGLAQGDSIILSWDHIPDADLWKYVIRQGRSWEVSQIILDGVTENTASWDPPMDGTYRFWIKAVDDYGIESVDAVDCVVTIDISTSLNIIWQREELPQGVPDAELDRLVSLDSGARLSWLPSLTDQHIPDYTDQDIGYYRGDTGAGIYTSQVYDLGMVTPFTLRLGIDFDAIMIGATDLTYPSRTDLTYPADTDLRITNLSTCRLEYRVCEEEGGLSEWTPYTTAIDLAGRYLQLRAMTELDSVGVHFDFLRFSIIADVPEQELVFKAAIAADGTRFTFEELGLRPMLMMYHVGVTILGIAALSPVVDEEPQAFTVRCFDALGNSHAAQTSIEVRGF
jgi:hypothetical protein